MNVQYSPVLGRDRLFWIDDFLHRHQCEQILNELQFAFWYPSTVLRRYQAGVRSVRTLHRVSETTDEAWFTPELLKMIGALRRRLVPLVPGIRTRSEKWQVTRYGRGGRFDYHYDCGQWFDEPSGERLYTVLIYLNTPRRGGSTCFFDGDLEIKATAGRLLVWRNLTAERECDADMLHASAPLTAGHKTVLVTWVRERDIHSKETEI